MKKTPRNSSKESQVTKTHIRVTEGVFILTVALSLFLFVALITYHHSDPGWWHAATHKAIANRTGWVGAWFADSFLVLFGFMAYAFPLMIAYTAWLILREHKKANSLERDYTLLIIRGIGFLLLLIAGAALLSLHAFSQHFLPYRGGGLLGNVIADHLVPVLNYLGTTLLLFAILLAGMTLMTGLSWISLTEHTGKIVIRLATWLAKQSQALHVFIQDYLANRRQAQLVSTPQDKPRTKVEPQIKQALPLKIEPKVELSISQAPKLEPTINLPTTHVKPAKRASTERQVKLFDTDADNNLPPLSLLDASNGQAKQKGFSKLVLEKMSKDVEEHLKDFGIDVLVVAVHPGPVITRFELQLAPGIKVSRISGLSKDLARSLSVVSVRIVEVIPGKSVIGLEVPNEHRETVCLSEVLNTEIFEQARSPLTIALGKDIAGNPMIVDLTKMPHLLVAGTTGSGKSVSVNAMLMSLLYKATPKDCRLIMIDPKMLELSIYDGIAHLLTPVVTDMKEAANALRWCVGEMDRRYRLMAALGVRNLSSFNQKISDAEKKNQPITDPLWKGSPDEQAPYLQRLPYIVVVIDELADMMMVVGKKVEQLIARIAQKARAAGIHMILATQRPSVDVITGLIKANVPTRIAFQVSSKIDSRTIIDQQGAEQLLGHGDMLYLPPGSGVPIRIHGAFVADHEVHKVVKELKKHGEPDYLEEVLAVNYESDLDSNPEQEGDAESDPLYDQAVQIVIETRRASISSIQRRLKIGYNRAARLVEQMESAGLVGPMESNGMRDVLIPNQS